MNEQSEGAHLCTVMKSTRCLLHTFPSFSQVTSEVVPTCQHAPMMAEHSACECRYGNDMKLERKRGLAQTNKGKPSAQKRNATHININKAKQVINCLNN